MSRARKANSRRPGTGATVYRVRVVDVADVNQAAGWRCPDCLSTASRPVEDAAGILHVRISHDDSCPWLAARERAAR